MVGISKAEQLVRTLRHDYVQALMELRTAIDHEINQVTVHGQPNKLSLVMVHGVLLRLRR